MANIEPILYADGALRLTRHGAGRGDTVLMRTWDNKQASFLDEDTQNLAQLIEADAAQGVAPTDIFHHAIGRFGRF